MVNTRGRAGSSKPFPANPVPPARQNQKQKKPVEEEAPETENTDPPTRHIAKPRARTRQNDGGPVAVGEAVEVSAPVNRKRRARSRSVDGGEEMGAVALQAQGATITVGRLALPAITEGSPRSSSPLPEDSDLRQSPTPSHYSSVSNLPGGSQLLVEGVDPEYAIEVMPELHSHADTILTQIATNVNDFKALRAELKDEGSRDFKKLERFNTYLVKVMEDLGSGDYIPVSGIQALLETPRYNEVMYEANLAVLARWCGTVDWNDATLRQALMELDRIFPKYFIAGGDEQTFEVGLEIRTQALIISLEQQPEGSHPDIQTYINHFFRNINEKLKGWDGLMYSEWRPAVNKRLEDITKILGDEENIAALREHYKWDAFLVHVHSWIRDVNANKERISRVAQSLSHTTNHALSPPLTAHQPQPGASMDNVKKRLDFNPAAPTDSNSAFIQAYQKAVQEDDKENDATMLHTAHAKAKSTKAGKGKGKGRKSIHAIIGSMPDPKKEAEKPKKRFNESQAGAKAVSPISEGGPSSEQGRGRKRVEREFDDDEEDEFEVLAEQEPKRVKRNPAPPRQQRQGAGFRARASTPLQQEENGDNNEPQNFGGDNNYDDDEEDVEVPRPGSAASRRASGRYSNGVPNNNRELAPYVPPNLSMRSVRDQALAITGKAAEMIRAPYPDRQSWSEEAEMALLTMLRPDRPEDPDPYRPAPQVSWVSIARYPIHRCLVYRGSGLPYRNNVAIKDKCFQLKLDFLRAGRPMPWGLMRINLRARDVKMLTQLGVRDLVGEEESEEVRLKNIAAWNEFVGQLDDRYYGEDSEGEYEDEEEEADGGIEVPEDIDEGVEVE